MKKTALFALLTLGVLASSASFAATTQICTGTAQASNGVSPANNTAGTYYLVTSIAPKCSANVIVEGVDGTSGAWYALGSVSVKGKNSFKGNTNGGSVSANVACAIPGGCTDAEAQTARDVANTQAASS